MRFQRRWGMEMEQEYEIRMAPAKERKRERERGPNYLAAWPEVVVAVEVLVKSFNGVLNLGLVGGFAGLMVFG